MDVGGGDGSETADAPVLPAEFDNRRRHAAAVRFAGVEDQGDAVAELSKNVLSTGARRRAREVGACAREGNAKFFDEAAGDFVFGPAHGDAPAIGGDFEGEPVRSVNDDGERAGPAGFREAIEIVGKIFRNDHGVIDRTDEDGESALLGAPFDAENLFDCGEIDRVSSQGVERVGGNGDDSTAVEPGRGIADDTWVGIGRADFEHLS